MALSARPRVLLVLRLLSDWEGDEREEEKVLQTLEFVVFADEFLRRRRPLSYSLAHKTTT